MVSRGIPTPLSATPICMMSPLFVTFTLRFPPRDIASTAFLMRVSKAPSILVKLREAATKPSLLFNADILEYARGQRTLIY